MQNQCNEIADLNYIDLSTYKLLILYFKYIILVLLLYIYVLYIFHKRENSIFKNLEHFFFWHRTYLEDENTYSKCNQFYIEVCVCQFSVVLIPHLVESELSFQNEQSTLLFPSQSCWGKHETTEWYSESVKILKLLWENLRIAILGKKSYRILMAINSVK